MRVSDRAVTGVQRLEPRTLLAITPPAFASAYRPVFVQDFTAMTTLSVSANGPVGPAGTTWMAHKPGGGDWFPFADPDTAQNPFALNASGLSIAVRKNASPANGFAGYTGGLLSSMDSAGNGFAQQYGYFEISMKTPGTANTWPAFWLLGRNAVIDPSVDGAEIDVTESYGNWGAGPNNSPPGDGDHTVASWHQWNADGTHAGDGFAVRVPGLSADYHTYGVDVEPTGITYYVDRNVVWTAPIYDAAKNPMFVMVNLALGGGSYNNAAGTGYDWDLTPSPSTLGVRYVSVWASPASPNYAAALSADAGGVVTGPDAGSARAAFDNDLSTYFDAPASGHGWAGLDLGSAKLVTEVSFAPRAGYGGRMTGGAFQASNAADFSSGVLTLYRVSAAPDDGVQAVAVSSGTAFRYVRYLPPDGTPGDVAEVAFKTLNAPAVVSGVTAFAVTGTRVNLDWAAPAGATRYDIYRGLSAGGEDATPVASVAGTRYADLTVTPGTAYFYRVVAANPSGVGPASDEVTATPLGPGTVTLTGTTIGTTGSWSGGASGVYTAADGAGKLFDGRLDTYFDAPAATLGNGVWAGLDLGTARRVLEIGFAPRAGFESRMAGGKFQASSSADFAADVVDLYTIGATPTAGIRTAAVDSLRAYRYVRYLSPDGGWGNAAEIVFRGTVSTPAYPPAPADLTAVAAGTGRVYLGWAAATADATALLIERRTGPDGVWALIARVAAGVTTYTDAGLAAGTTYAYRVRAAGVAGAGDASAVAVATTLTGGPSRPTVGRTAAARTRTILLSHTLPLL